MKKEAYGVSYRMVQSPMTRKAEASEDRTITFVASDNTRDSAGTVLNQNNWDLSRFNSNPIIGYQHKVYGGLDDTQNPDNVIGKGYAYVEEGRLMVDITFEPAEINPLAEKIYQKVLFGSLRAVSVGFLPTGHGRFGDGDEAIDGANETYYFAGQQLLEISIVNIPANPNALKKGMDADNEFLEAERKRLSPEVETKEVEKPAEDNQEEMKSLSDDIDRAITMARAALHINNN